MTSENSLLQTATALLHYEYVFGSHNWFELAHNYDMASILNYWNNPEACQKSKGLYGFHVVKLINLALNPI